MADPWLAHGWPRAGPRYRSARSASGRGGEGVPFQQPTSGPEERFAPLREGRWEGVCRRRLPREPDEGWPSGLGSGSSQAPHRGQSPRRRFPSIRVDAGAAFENRAQRSASNGGLLASGRGDRGGAGRRHFSTMLFPITPHPVAVHEAAAVQRRRPHKRPWRGGRVCAETPTKCIAKARRYARLAAPRRPGRPQPSTAPCWRPRFGGGENPQDNGSFFPGSTVFHLPPPPPGPAGCGWLRLAPVGLNIYLHPTATN